MCTSFDGDAGGDRRILPGGCRQEPRAAARRPFPTGRERLVADRCDEAGMTGNRACKAFFDRGRDTPRGPAPPGSRSIRRGFSLAHDQRASPTCKCHEYCLQTAEKRTASKPLAARRSARALGPAGNRAGLLGGQVRVRRGRRAPLCRCSGISRSNQKPVETARRAPTGNRDLEDGDAASWDGATRRSSPESPLRDRRRLRHARSRPSQRRTTSSPKGRRERIRPAPSRSPRNLRRARSSILLGRSRGRMTSNRRRARAPRSPGSARLAANTRRGRGRPAAPACSTGDPPPAPVETGPSSRGSSRS